MLLKLSIRQDWTSQKTKHPPLCVSCGRCLQHIVRSTLWAGSDIWENQEQEITRDFALEDTGVLSVGVYETFQRVVSDICSLV